MLSGSSVMRKHTAWYEISIICTWDSIFPGMISGCSVIKNYISAWPKLLEPQVSQHRLDAKRIY